MTKRPANRGVKNPGRRRFLSESAQAACGASLLGIGMVFHSESSKGVSAQALRPPGALVESDFLSACVRCGLCVEACPYDTLSLGRPFVSRVANGTPYFEAREIPCEMCEDIPCVVACPSGALDHNLTDIDDARMGLAVLIDRETCLNLNGLRCDICYRVCPLIDEAITLERRRNERTGAHAVFEPVVHSDACTGCGKCERACILELAAIKVIPLELAKGEIGKHYRLGWEEKQKAEGALVPNIIDLPDRMPEGIR